MLMLHFTLCQFFCCHIQSGETPLLIATDVAARGLDIDDVEVVINYSFPLVRWRLLAQCQDCAAGLTAVLAVTQLLLLL